MIAETIREKITQELQPVYLELENESHRHSVPKGSETHFRLLVVSARFEGLNRVQRQRLIHSVLEAELAGPVHALSQRALTPEEWNAQGQNVEMKSPPCHGGSKTD